MENRFKKKKISLHRKRYSTCKHMSLEISEELSQVTCKECGETLNPVSVLLRFSREESMWESQRLNLIKERKRIEKRKQTKCEHCGKTTSISNT